MPGRLRAGRALSRLAERNLVQEGSRNFHAAGFGASMGAVDALPVSPVIVGVAVAAALALWGWRTFYQFCPHCGAPTRRVRGGWLRCRRCGRQYRRGLRLR
jgi:hypothetical protein